MKSVQEIKKNSQSHSLDAAISFSISDSVGLKPVSLSASSTHDLLPGIEPVWLWSSFSKAFVASKMDMTKQVISPAEEDVCAILTVTFPELNVYFLFERSSISSFRVMFSYSDFSLLNRKMGKLKANL